MVWVGDFGVLMGCVCWLLQLVCYYGSFALGLGGCGCFRVLLTLFVFS